MNIPVVNFQPLLDATSADWRARLESLLARRVFILGEELRGFEAEFAATMEAREAIGVGNGTAAIELCLRDAGVTSPKQEVITSALTAPFTGIGIIGAGASIRFADVDPETLLIDLDDVENRVTRRTAAIVPVHLYGNPVDLGRARRIARAAGAKLIQDACQAHGATLGGRSLAAFSDYVTYSFYPTKNLGALGDGGAIVTNRPAIAVRLRMWRDGGRRAGEQVSRIRGINSRLDEMQACFLRAFLPRLAESNAHRARIAGIYTAKLADCPGVRLLRTGAGSAWHLYVIRAAKRDKLRAHLAAQGIGTGIHYGVPLHVMPAFRECGLKRGDLPHAEKACREVLSLPLWPGMPEPDAERVADAVRGFYA